MISLVIFLTQWRGCFLGTLVTLAASGTEPVTNRSSSPLGGKSRLPRLHPCLRLPQAVHSHSLQLPGGVPACRQQASPSLHLPWAPAAPPWPRARASRLWPVPMVQVFTLMPPDTIAHFSPAGPWRYQFLVSIQPETFSLPPPSLFMTPFFLSSQLYHRPVVSFPMDPYICIPSPGEMFPLDL